MSLPGRQYPPRSVRNMASLLEMWLYIALFLIAQGRIPALQVSACKQAEAPSQYYCAPGEFVARRPLFVTTGAFNISGRALSDTVIPKLLNVRHMILIFAPAYYSSA